MKQLQIRSQTGWLFIVGAVLVNVPYTLLIIFFDYPDILRLPAGEILIRFQAGGAGLIYTWLAFAWVGLPLLFAIILLGKTLDRSDSPLMKIATVAGIMGAVAQMVGLLRWVFVVPGIARIYTDPATDHATRQAALVVFQTVHQSGGVLLGEHIGQVFTILWMVLISLVILRDRFFQAWLGWFGIMAGLVYSLAQTELLATVIPETPVLDLAGLVGSLLWLAWMILLGIFLIRWK